MTVRSYATGLIFCALPAGIAVPARAAVELDDRVSHYAIQGGNLDDLRREMNAKGPPGPGGKRFAGYTRWDVNWRYGYQRNGAQCAIGRVQTSLRITMTLPAWQPPDGVNRETRAQWQRYMDALTQHEMGHRKHGVDAADEIDRAIRALPPQPGCDALGAQANARAEEIIRRYNQRDLDYDRDTRHGINQGARLP